MNRGRSRVAAVDPGRLPSALTRDFGQYDACGNRGIERLRGAGHRYRHHRITVLPHQPRQALAFRSDDQNHRFGGIEVVDCGVTVGVESYDPNTGRRPLIECAIEVGGPGNRHPRRRTRTGAPGHRGHRSRPPLRNEDAMTGEGRN